MRELWDEGVVEANYTPFASQPFTTHLISERIALLALEDGEPVGTVYANLTHEQAGVVFGLYVRPTARRRRGIARALMVAIAEALQTEGRTHMQLSVDRPNKAARSLYKTMGFEDAAWTMRIEAANLVS
ncbi:MAG: GNAT family N-acetyltransferase [Actinobacteria bacterium]|nr:GNAT family N-acetyltransferase [Actinomycetota bacterium]